MKACVSLNGKWKLKGTDPYVPLRENSMETGKALEGVTSWIDAQVPGGVALALFEAGYIEHPYKGMNSLKCEWIENRWWIYRCEFDKTLKHTGKIKLCFDGVDYECIVYLNRQLLGEHEGMFDRFTYDITELYEQADHFVLEVLIKSAPDEMGQIGRTSMTHTQKSRFGYKWDFSTRLVNLGIWQDVYLAAEDQAALDDLSVTTDVTGDGIGLIRVGGTITQHAPVDWVFLVGFIYYHAAVAAVKDGGFVLEIKVNNPQLWYPNGVGAQPLYDVKICLWENGALLDAKTIQTGIRRIEYLHNENAPKEAGPYTIAVNGVRVYMKGVNIVPLDHIYGDVSREQVEYKLRQAVDMNVNIVRVWGGGVIETEWFYHCCDAMGLMVWQEFIQSSSGLDNFPSQNPKFLKLLKIAASQALKEKRNHPSLVAWSGGNELLNEKKTPVDETNPNIAILAQLTHELDPSRQFFPTSPSGPNSHISPNPDECYDVHGWWQYQGNPRQYSYFGDTDSLLHSEFGCDGMSCMETVQRILPKKATAPVKMKYNDMWRFHGDWWCTFDREESMFGPIEQLEKYVMMSQWMQAEGLRFILEANQRRKWRNSGSIIWQLNEPWPNLSCTSLIDYYGNEKMAYYWAKKAFSSVHIAMDYRRLDYAPGASFAEKVIVYTQQDDPAASIIMEVLTLDGVCVRKTEMKAELVANRVNEVGRFRFTVPEVPESFFIVRLSVCAMGETAVNEYYFSTQGEKPYQAAVALCGGQLRCSVVEQGEHEAVLAIENTGTRAVLHAFVLDQSQEWNLRMTENYHTLLPAEQWRVGVAWSRRFRIGFDPFSERNTEKPHLVLKGIGLETPCEIRL